MSDENTPFNMTPTGMLIDMTKELRREFEEYRKDYRRLSEELSQSRIAMAGLTEQLFSARREIAGFKQEGEWRDGQYEKLEHRVAKNEASINGLKNFRVQVIAWVAGAFFVVEVSMRVWDFVKNSGAAP